MGADLNIDQILAQISTEPELRVRLVLADHEGPLLALLEEVKRALLQAPCLHDSAGRPTEVTLQPSLRYCSPLLALGTRGGRRGGGLRP